MDKLAEIQKIAIERGGECLATEYLGSKLKMRFKCAVGHEWSSVPNRGSWCPYCAGMRIENPLLEMQQLAAERGGECLATEYINSSTKLPFRCQDGHDFDMRPANLKHMAQWCPYCSRNRIKNPLLELQQLAAERGGECLATEYLGSQSKLPFRCKVGHEWDAQPANVRNSGHWCPYCSRNRIENPLLELQQLAAERGGECLATEYLGSQSKLPFRCKVGHEWDVSPNSLINLNSWCPYCTGHKILDPLGEIQQLAAERGGECLATEYINSSTKLPFRCQDGHDFDMRPANLKHMAQWCPYCGFKTEGLVRLFFETIFHVKFPQKSPSWLSGGHQNRYILDGYNEQLKMAFEYHGQQHFENVKHFHRDDDALKRQKQRDGFVRDCCASVGVTLIEINSLENGFSQDTLIQAVKKAIESASRFQISESSISEFKKLPFAVSHLVELKAFAASKGGDCLAEKYLGVHSPVTWVCSHLHVWNAAWNDIRNDHWCPVCSGKTILEPLVELQKIAEEHGGLCLSTTYVTSKDGIEFQCQHGHRWSAIPNSIKKGRWCAICSGNILIDPIGELQAIAEKKGGLCLATEYVNGSTKLKFRCGEGHEWDAQPGNIKHGGSWCPVCTKQRPINPLGLLEFQQLAVERGGECLTTEYLGSKLKMRFKCAVGHEWDARPGDIKNKGSWCPICARRKPK